MTPHFCGEQSFDVLSLTPFQSFLTLLRTRDFRIATTLPLCLTADDEKSHYAGSLLDGMDGHLRLDVQTKWCDLVRFGKKPRSQHHSAPATLVARLVSIIKAL